MWPEQTVNDATGLATPQALATLGLLLITFDFPPPTCRARRSVRLPGPAIAGHAPAFAGPLWFLPDRESTGAGGIG